MRLVLIEVFEFSEVLTLLEVEVFRINILYFFGIYFQFFCIYFGRMVKCSKSIA